MLSRVINLRDTLYLFESTEAQLMRSTNNGSEWSLIDPIGWPEGIDRILGRDSVGGAITVLPADLGELWEAIHRGDTIIALTRDAQLHRSFDAGITWESYPVRGNDGIALHDDTIWVGLHDGIHTMPIDGEAWSLRATLDHDPILTTFLFTAERTLVADLMGTYAWENESGRFARLEEGRHNHFVRQIVPAGDTLLVTTQYGLYATGDDGATWRIGYGPRGQGVQTLRWDDGRLYARDVDSLYRSDDRGRSWIHLPPDSATPSDPATIYADRGLLFVGGAGGIGRTTDGAAGWERLSLATTGRVIGIDGAGDTLVARATGDARLHLSTDFGSTWTTIPMPPVSTAYDVMVYEEGVLTVGSIDSGLARSTDLGKTWTRTMSFNPWNEPLERSGVRIVTLDVYGDTLFTRVDYGEITPDHLYVSVNGGSDWQELTYPESGPMAVVPWRGRLLAATEYLSVQALQVTLGVTDRRVRRAPLPITYDAESRVIGWSSDAPTTYAVEIYTLAGAHVMTVASGAVEAGAHIAPLPTGNLPSGTYLVMVRAAEEWSVVRVEVVR